MNLPLLARALGLPSLTCDGTDSIEPEAEAMERRAVDKIELMLCEKQEEEARLAFERQQLAELRADNERALATFERDRPTIINVAIDAAYAERRLTARTTPTGQREPDPLEAHARGIADEETGLAGVESMRDFLSELPRSPTFHKH